MYPNRDTLLTTFGALRNRRSSGLRGDAGFPAEDRAFARQDPVVAAEAPRLSDHAVAGDDERHGIAADGRTDGARGLRPAEMGGDVRVGRGLAYRDPQEGLPHPDLEVAADKYDPQGLI